MASPVPESATRAHHRWILGRYVQLVAVLQLMVYTTDGLADHPNIILFSMDPRFLISMAMEAFFTGSHEFPSALSWVSLFSWLTMGEAVVQSRTGLMVYAVVEGTYAVLFLAFTALIVAVNLSPSHGISPREIIIPFGVFVVASAVPLVAALPLWRAPDPVD